MKQRKNNKFRVCELFAGVGGFHLGLQKSGWKVVWANQWEPGKKAQYAFDCYAKHFQGKGTHSNDDIAWAKKELKNKKKFGFELLVGGFPCQDYSVATANAKGIHGKKGVLWWEINDIITIAKPPYILLENVDRLLRSPAKQRGKDFGVILACLYKHGYYVEWRVINAADYGFPQKRRRTFIFATKNKALINTLTKGKNIIAAYKAILLNTGFFAPAFPVTEAQDNGEGPLGMSFHGDGVEIDSNPKIMSDNFAFHFKNAGLMYKGKVFTLKVISTYKGKRTLLRDILSEKVNSKYYLLESDLPAWRYCKGAKSEERVKKEGYKYFYTEGAIPFPEHLNQPSRTMLTSEGAKKPNRISHVVEFPKGCGKYRLITPGEAEKLNGFPRGWTDTGMPERWRYFCMGNALVVGLIEKLGKRIKDVISSSS